MRNASKWKKFKDKIEIDGQLISITRYKCLNGCGMTTTKEPNKKERCQGCSVNNRRLEEANNTATARVKGGIPKRKGGNFKEVDTEGANPHSPPDKERTSL